jgi:hypothetical protein
MIDYPKAGAYSISANNAKIAPIAWNNAIGNYSEIKRDKCGEHRFFGVTNVLEFYIEPDCTIIIQPVDAIMTNIRLQWTMAEFYKTGGSIAFIDKMAASLGIHASNIKVVAVY